MPTDPALAMSIVRAMHYKRGAIAARLHPHHFGSSVTNGRWRAYRWLQFLSPFISDAVRRGGGRVIVNAPPRMGKSKFLTQIVPAWFLENWPERKVLAVANSIDIVREAGREVRNLVRTSAITETKVSSDSKAAHRWNTSAGGCMAATTVRGATFGTGGHLILVDDPYANWEKAQSKRERDAVIAWFDGTLYNRMEPGATIIVLHSRMHNADLTGHLLRHHPDKWTHVRLPGLAEPADPMGRIEGEPLCPERYPLPEMQMLIRGAGAEKGQALYQQSPVEAGKGNVYRNWSAANELDTHAELNPALNLDIMLDFNINPGMHLEVGNYCSLTDRFQVIHEIHGPRMNVPECMDALDRLVVQLGGWRKFVNEDRPLRIFGDASGKSATAQTGVTSYQILEAKLRDFGVPHVRRVPKANPAIADRVNCVNEVLMGVDRVRRLFVHPRCVRLLDDMRNQVADPWGMPDKTDNEISHSSEALGYWVQRLRPMIDAGAVRALQVGGFVY